MVAQRLMLLDHLSMGRAMLGVGPGAVPLDATMPGIDQANTRPRLEEGFDAIMALLHSDEPVSIETDWLTLREAELHLKPFSRPELEVAVAAAAVSPTGARLAARHGAGLLSIRATSNAGFDALRSHWQVMEEQSAARGTVVSRDRWRLAGPMHIAPTREQAYRDVEYGLLDWAIYFQRVGAVPQLQIEGSTTRSVAQAAAIDAAKQRMLRPGNSDRTARLAIIATRDPPPYRIGFSMLCRPKAHTACSAAQATRAQRWHRLHRPGRA